MQWKACVENEIEKKSATHRRQQPNVNHKHPVIIARSGTTKIKLFANGRKKSTTTTKE